MNEDGLTIDQLLKGFDLGQAAADAQKAHHREIRGLLIGMIETVDALEAFERHLNIAGKHGISAANCKTLQRIVRKLLRVLQFAGVEPVNALGKPVDLERCEVVDVRHDADASDDTVVEEIVRGYALRRELLRRGRVVVAKSVETPVGRAATVGAIEKDG